MELIPILSLIILVATLSTFIFAVGAYILYKIRERKGRETAAPPATIPAELVSPVPMMAEQEEAKPMSGRTYTRETAQQPVYAPTRATGPQLRPTYVSQQAPSPRYTPPTLEGERYSTQKKFTRYTTESTTDAKREEKKKEEEESLRWR
jgi:hypothetical protein